MNNLGGEGIELWDEEDGFYYDVLHLPGGGQPPAARALDGRPHPALRRRDAGARHRRPPARLQAAHAVVHREPARASRATSRRSRPDDGTCAASSRSSNRDRLRSVLLATCSTRRVPLAPTASARSRASTATTRTCSTSTGMEHRVDYEPAESSHRPLRRQLELARPDLVPGELPDHRVAAEVPPLPRRPLQGRVSRPGSGRTMTLWEVAAELSRRLTRIFLRDDERAAAGLRRRREVPDRPALARPASSSTSTSTATTAPASAPATRPAGPGSSPSCSSRAANRRDVIAERT